MLKNILKRGYYLLRSWLKPINRIGKTARYFFMPNIMALIGKRVVCKSRPVCNQLTLFTGLGKIFIGDKCSFGYKPGGFHHGGSVEIQPRYENSRVIIGDRVATNNNLFICAANHIEIGHDTLIGLNVVIMDHEAHGLEPDKRRQVGAIGKVILGNNVWLGNSVTILKNSEIGDNTVVAAGAVVSGIFPANVVIGGVPAKIIKEL